MSEDHGSESFVALLKWDDIVQVRGLSSKMPNRGF